MTAKKVALVTGSGRRRVGWHVAQALAERGWRLALHHRASAAGAAENVAELRAAGVEAEAFPADLSDERQVRRLADAVLERFGRIDALVNAAARWTPRRLEEVTAAEVRGFFEDNALSTFLCAQQFGLAMVRQSEGGAIVNLGDWATARPYLHYAAYFPSKGAVEALTRALAVEFSARNPRVRVNCVLPGPVLLPADLPAEERAAAIAGTLVQREGRPEELAQAVVHLIENEFITGVCLPVDGGRTLQGAEGARPGAIAPRIDPHTGERGA